MRGDDTPGALYTHLHEDGVCGKAHHSRGDGPQVCNGNGQCGRDDDGAPASCRLTPGAEGPAAQNGADVVNDGNVTGGVGIESVLLPEEGWIHILGAVTVEIE